MNDLKIFKNEEFGEIRTVVIYNEPYFIGKDITDKLGYQNGSRDINRHVDKEDIKTWSFNDGSQIRNMLCINESGLYSLVLGSQLPAAKKFKRWVTGEVLPTIRKNGMYATDELLDNPDLLIKVATALKEERTKNALLVKENKVKEQIIGELKPKADYTDLILKNKGLVTITQIAKDYGMTGQAMNELLHSLKIQFKQSDQWLLYKEHQDKGYTHSETINITRKDGRPDITMNTKWTQKGRLFIYETLKKDGILPTIEKEDEWMR